MKRLARREAKRRQPEGESLRRDAGRSSPVRRQSGAEKRQVLGRSDEEPVVEIGRQQRRAGLLTLHTSSYVPE